MSRSLYISSLEGRSGKALVACALMEHLSGRFGHVSVFRPVITGDAGSDKIIALLTSFFGLSFLPHEMYGLTMDEARPLLASGNYDELYIRILERYKALEGKSDFVLCVGSDYSGSSAALEFDFNVEVARNLSSPLMPVLNGRGRDAATLVRGLRGITESMEEKKCDIRAIIINRVAEKERDDLVAAVRERPPDARPVYVVPEEPQLDRPTVNELADALGAACIWGDAARFEGEVANLKIGAMELPNFLDYLEAGSLVITPADRSDIVLGTMMADRSTSYPSISGIVLTGNLNPAPQIVKLMQGFKALPVPVIHVGMDTFTAVTRINNLLPSFAAKSKRRIEAALGIVNECMDFTDILGEATIPGPGRMTPLMFQYELIRKAKLQRKHIVLPEGTEERILRAAEIALVRDLCDITLLGDPEEVSRKASELGLSIGRANIIEPKSSDMLPDFARIYYELRKHKGISPDMAQDIMTDVSYFGTMMVHLGHADGMVSGSVHTTAHTIRPSLEFVKTRPGISIVSSTSFMCLPDRVLVYSDCAVVPDPTTEQLADIAISSAETASGLGIEPRIAMLSYSTGESGHGPEVDRVRAATQIIRERRPDLMVEGPIQYDAAIDTTVAKLKLPGSDVAGHATIFIFPDLNAGNNAYKAVQRATNAVAIGPILQGLNKPVNDLSRGALVPDIVNTIAITVIQAQGGIVSR
ncbi:MAG: phosphate acetyltransferase [Syntrophorhabdus sp.]